MPDNTIAPLLLYIETFLVTEPVEFVKRALDLSKLQR